MGRGKRLEITLTPKDRQRIGQLLGGGLQSVRTVVRALALLQVDQGQSTPALGANLMLSAKAVWQIGKRYQGGMSPRGPSISGHFFESVLTELDRTAWCTSSFH